MNIISFQKLVDGKYFAKVDNLFILGTSSVAFGGRKPERNSDYHTMGVYRFLSCPFGISITPGEYQARMAHEVLQDYYLNGAVVYIDDTIIYGRNEETIPT